MPYKNPEDAKKQNRIYCQNNREKVNAYKRKWAINNPEKIKESRKQWINNNPEYIKPYDREYHKQDYIKNKEVYSERMKKYYIKNREKLLEYTKKHNIKNKVEIAIYKREYCLNNPGKIREGKKRWATMKRKTDDKYNINRKVRLAMWRILKNNKAGRQWESILGYSVANLIKHLKSTMPEGYTWQDCLDGKLHIDHIVPISAHNFSSFNHIDFLNCWTLSNLQLLPARENLIKGAKLSKPFQPALQILI